MGRVVNYDTHIASEPHRVRIVGYDAHTNCHKCQWGDAPSQVALIDFVGDVTGGEELIGKLVDVDYTFGHIFLSVGARIVSDQGPGKI